MLLKSFFDQSELQTNGLTVGGTKYTFLKHDDGFLLGKLKEGGCIVAKTKQSKYGQKFNRPDLMN